MPDTPKPTHLHDTPVSSGFRFLSELIAWITGPWAAWLVHPLLGLGLLTLLVGLPTVFTTQGDKKHVMVATPGPLRALIDFFQYGVAVIAPWFVVSDVLASLAVVIVIAAIILGLPRYRWLMSGASLDS